MSGRFTTRSGRLPAASLAMAHRAVRAAVPAAIEAAGALLVEQIAVELSTEGRGRIRGQTTRRTGAGAYRNVTGEWYTDARGVRRQRKRRVTRGRAATSLAKATRASAPGDPPAPFHNFLRGSVTMDRVTTGTRLGVRVGPHARYARALEEGTRTAGRSRRVVILPRPFMRPALAKVQAALGARFGIELRAHAADRMTR